MTDRAVAAALFDDPSREFAVELWDGTLLPAARPAHSDDRLVVRDRSAIAALAPPVDEERAAQAFASGALDIAGDTVRVLEAIALWRGPRVRLAHVPALAPAWVRAAARRPFEGGWARLRGRAHSAARDAAAVARHYDVSNDFYRLFLDETMTYSCAFFPTGGESLAEAQRAKLDLVCRKLDLRRGDALLDVGCGWGGLVAHAVEEHGASAFGATVSGAQFVEARRRLSAHMGRGTPRVEVYERDYRELPSGPFDKAASVGMMEHVGRANLDRYFAEVYSRLREGGLFLNQAIADVAEGARTIGWMRRRAGGFVQRHVFPDSDLVPLGIVIQAAERQGFEVRDVDGLREHYAETLRRWLAGLEARFDEAERLVGSTRARRWRLYLAASAVAFQLGLIGVYQVLLAKRGAGGRASGVPRSRRIWYEVAPRPSQGREPEVAGEQPRTSSPRRRRL